MGAVPVCSIDPFDEAVLADPYPMHEQLRELGPVVRLSAYDIWAMARYEHVQAALIDHDTFCSSAGVGLSDFRKQTPWRPPSLLLEADPPAHTRARRPVTRAMSPGTVRRSAELLTTEATALFDRLAGRDEIDGIGDVAIPYPLTVFPDIVGLPVDGREHLLPYGDMVFNGFGPRNRLFAEAMSTAAAVREYVAATCRAESLAPDGMGARLHEYAAADGFSTDQRELLMRSLLSAGLDTTVHAIGNALWCLATHPDQYALLYADPGRAAAAFEEALRYESAVQTFFRTTTRAVAVGDVEIPAGEKVLLFLGAANRDHRRWPDPGRFDIERRASGHVAFGAGIHACVGAALARAEGTAVLAELARRYADVRLAGAPEPQLNNTLRALRSLPLTVTPAPAAGSG
jgi:4-methoxybenzoate monooxygenase (O-demethylating)